MDKVGSTYGQWVQIWQKFFNFAQNFKSFLAILLKVWQHLELTLAIFCFWAKVPCCEVPDIKQTI